MTELITCMEQVTPHWLTETLRRNGHLSPGEVTAVQTIAVHMAPHSTTASLVVDYSPHAAGEALPTHLFLKVSRTHPDLGNKEVKFYTNVAPVVLSAAADLPFARCYDAVVTETGEYHVLLEDLSVTHVTQPWPMPPTSAQAKGMLHSLARLHAAWWEHPQLGVMAPLPTETILQDIIKGARVRCAEMLDGMGDRIAPARRAIYTSLCDAWPTRRMSRMCRGQGLTLVHRDTHFANFMHPLDPVHDTTRLIDWHSWRVQVGADDIAYTIACQWFPEWRARLEEALLRSYYDDLLVLGVRGYTWDDLWYDYRASVIRCLLMLIANWSIQNVYINWHRIELGTLAFEDLGCAELLHS
jgi:hypothetical protein